MYPYVLKLNRSHQPPPNINPSLPKTHIIMAFGRPKANLISNRTLKHLERDPTWQHEANDELRDNTVNEEFISEKRRRCKKRSGVLEPHLSIRDRLNHADWNNIHNGYPVHVSGGYFVGVLEPLTDEYGDDQCPYRQTRGPDRDAYAREGECHNCPRAQRSVLKFSTTRERALTEEHRIVPLGH